MKRGLIEDGIWEESLLPKSAVLELTYKCNHACRFCYCPWYAGMITPGREMSVDEWKDCMTELVSAGVSLFSFTGGEMLLKPGWQEIIRHAASLKAPFLEKKPDCEEYSCIRKSPEIFLLTNGKLLSEEVLDICKEINATLSISLPGLTTYESHTCGGTTPDYILDWFIKAKQRGIRTVSGITVTSENFHELYQTVCAALLAGADTIMLNRFLPGGRGLKHRELELTPEQIREMPFLADKALTQSGHPGAVGTELPYCLAMERDQLNHLKVSTTCGAAKDFFVVGPSGKIRVCNHSPKELVHWNQWKELSSHPYWQSYINEENLPATCRGCLHTSLCDGGCREAAHVCHGSPNAMDPALVHYSHPPKPHNIA